jgi:ribosomal protein S6--L-glutamate ligase
MTPLRGLRIGFLERPHPPGHRGAVADRLVPLLREQGAQVDLVHAERGLHRLDLAPDWDLVVLKSGSAAALHLAAAAEAWGIPAVNRADATRLAQDKLASAVILQRAGLPIAPSYLAWLGPSLSRPNAAARRAAGTGGRPALRHHLPDGPSSVMDRLDTVSDRPLIVKAARGSQGIGLWAIDAGELADLVAAIPEGPYLLMERIAHTGDDLKVFAAGPWLVAIERPFPATTLEAKLGRPGPVPDRVAAVTREAGRLLGLTCYGCDFVRGTGGWTLVDVNAFPGYKGAAEAPAALAAEIARVAAVACPR